MTENISTLLEEADLIEELSMKSIGRDLQVEAYSWIYRGPIRMVLIRIEKHGPYLYFGLEWKAKPVKDGWMLDESNEKDPVLGEKFAIDYIDRIYLQHDNRGNDYLIAPGSFLFTVKIYPNFLSMI